MATMASWGSKTWEISPQRIAVINNISAKVELDTANNDDKEGSPATQTRALKLQSFNFDFDLAAVAGSDVRGEYESWTELIGQYAPFYLGGSRFGPKQMQLTSVELMNGVVDGRGRILSGKIAIVLTEYAEEASGKKASTASSGSGTPGISDPGNSVTSAVQIGASSTAKAAKKKANLHYVDRG